jgi:hypothetical protein
MPMPARKPPSDSFPGFAVQVEAERVYGLRPGPAGCEVNAPCGATAVSASGRLMAGNPRAHFYFNAGLITLRTETPGFDIANARTHDTGVGPFVGVGVKVAITGGFFVQPAFRAGTTLWMSRANLSTSRGSIAAGSQW